MSDHRSQTYVTGTKTITEFKPDGLEARLEAVLGRHVLRHVSSVQYMRMSKLREALLHSKLNAIGGFLIDFCLDFRQNLELKPVRGHHALPQGADSCAQHHNRAWIFAYRQVRIMVA